MNATQIKPMNFLPTDEWIVTIMNEIDALPTDIAEHLLPAHYLAALTAVASPTMVGVIYAQKGEIPDVILYDKDGDRAEFWEGFYAEREAIDAMAVAGKTDSRQHVLNDAEMAAATEDYRDSMEDTEWIRRGC